MFAALMILALQPAAAAAPVVPAPLEIADHIRSPLTAEQRARGPEMTNLAEVFTPANYPFLAKGRGDEGRVQFRVTIDARGVATGCTIVEPAVAPTLNRPTCDLILAKARFAPARDRRGRPVASTYMRRVSWALQDGPALGVGDGHERVVLTFDGAGNADCRIEATADVDVDPRTCDFVLATAMVRNMAGAKAETVKAQMARFAVVSEQSSFTGSDAAARAAEVGKRDGEDLNDRTMLRLTIDPVGKIKNCAVVEQGMQAVNIPDGEPGFVLSCARMAPYKFEPDETAAERTMWVVSAAYYRER